MLLQLTQLLDKSVAFECIESWVLTGRHLLKQLVVFILVGLVGRKAVPLYCPATGAFIVTWWTFWCWLSLSVVSISVSSQNEFNDVVSPLRSKLRATVLLSSLSVSLLSERLTSFLTVLMTYHQQLHLVQ